MKKKLSGLFFTVILATLQVQGGAAGDLLKQVTDSVKCRVCYTNGNMHCIDDMFQQGTCYVTQDEAELNRIAMSSSSQYCTRHLMEDIYKQFTCPPTECVRGVDLYEHDAYGAVKDQHVSWGFSFMSADIDCRMVVSAGSNLKGKIKIRIKEHSNVGVYLYLQPLNSLENQPKSQSLIENMLVFKNDEVFDQNFEIPTDWSAYFVYNTDPFFSGKLTIESMVEEVTDEEELLKFYQKWQPTELKPAHTVVVNTRTLDQIQAEINALYKQLDATLDPQLQKDLKIKIYELQSEMMNMHEPPSFTPTRIVTEYEYPEHIYINTPTAILMGGIILALLLCFGLIILVLLHKINKLQLQAPREAQNECNQALRRGCAQQNEQDSSSEMGFNVFPSGNIAKVHNINDQDGEAWVIINPEIMPKKNKADEAYQLQFVGTRGPYPEDLNLWDEQTPQKQGKYSFKNYKADQNLTSRPTPSGRLGRLPSEMTPKMKKATPTVNPQEQADDSKETEEHVDQTPAEADIENNSKQDMEGKSLQDLDDVFSPEKSCTSDFSGTKMTKGYNNAQFFDIYNQTMKTTMKSSRNDATPVKNSMKNAKITEGYGRVDIFKNTDPRNSRMQQTAETKNPDIQETFNELMKELEDAEISEKNLSKKGSLDMKTKLSEIVPATVPMVKGKSQNLPNKDKTPQSESDWSI